jgi:hypothetical protein
MAYRYGDAREQMILFPESIDQYVSEDHPVRAYDAFVDALDLAELGIDLNERKVGNSQYDPRLMLKLRTCAEFTTGERRAPNTRLGTLKRPLTFVSYSSEVAAGCRPKSRYWPPASI